MRRKRSLASPPAERPAATPTVYAAHLPPPGRVVSVGFEDVHRSWRTRVEQVDGATLVVVAPTRSLGEAIVPDVGRPVVMGWAADDGYFEAECSFLTADMDNVVTWVLAVRKIARLQRRTAFRIDASGPVTLRHGDVTVEARLRNLSEGGLCCAVPTSALRAEDGDHVEVSTELDQLGTFEAPAKVVRVSPAPTEPGEVELGLAFIGLNEDVTEDLRQFVFSEQLRRRRSLSGS